MAYRPNPNDPFVTPVTPPPTERPLPGDPILTEDPRFEEEGPISGTRVAVYAVAVLALVGALFYGMSTANNTNTASQTAPTTSSQTSPANNMAERPATTPSPAIRDVTPRNDNMTPGMTTGSSPSRPAPVETAPADAK